MLVVIQNLTEHPNLILILRNQNNQLGIMSNDLLKYRSKHLIWTTSQNRCSTSATETLTWMPKPIKQYAQLVMFPVTRIHSWLLSTWDILYTVMLWRMQIKTSKIQWINLPLCPITFSSFPALKDWQDTRCNLAKQARIFHITGVLDICCRLEMFTRPSTNKDGEKTVLSRLIIGNTHPLYALVKFRQGFKAPDC